MSVTDFVNAKRIMMAKEMLRRTDRSVGEVAERCGFDSLPHFHRVFRALTGTTPGAWRRSG
jgi:AraC-like DNA-binding protein